MFGRIRGLRDRIRKRNVHTEHELTLDNSNLTLAQIATARQALQILGLESRQEGLTKHDFIIFLYAMGLNPTDDIIDSKIRAFKLHHKKTFTFGQLAHVWYSMLQDLTDEDEILKRAFQFFDKDNNGEISVQELKTTMHELGDLLTEEEISDFMAIMDVNNDGVIGYTEFLATLKTQAPELASDSRLKASSEGDASTIGSGMFCANAHFLGTQLPNNVNTSPRPSTPTLTEAEAAEAPGPMTAAATASPGSGGPLAASPVRASAAAALRSDGGAAAGGRCSGGGAGGRNSGGGGAVVLEAARVIELPVAAATPGGLRPGSPEAAAGVLAGQGGTAQPQRQPQACLNASLTAAATATPSSPAQQPQPAHALAAEPLSALSDGPSLLPRPPSRRLGSPQQLPPQQPQLQQQSLQVQATHSPFSTPQAQHPQQFPQPHQAVAEALQPSLQHSGSRQRSAELAGALNIGLRTPSVLEPGPGSGSGSPVGSHRAEPPDCRPGSG